MEVSGRICPLAPRIALQGKKFAKHSSPLPSLLCPLILADECGWDSPEGRPAVVSHVHTMSKVINKIFEAPQGWIFKYLVLTDISQKSVSHIST